MNNLLLLHHYVGSERRHSNELNLQEVYWGKYYKRKYEVSHSAGLTLSRLERKGKTAGRKTI